MRESRTRRIGVTGAGAALAAGLILAALLSAPANAGHRLRAGVSSGAGTTPSAAAADIAPGAPGSTEATALLDRLGAAVRSHDRGAFAAGLDTSAAAKPFRSAELAAFDNLVQVPLSAWRYTLATPLTGGDVIKEAAARYAAPTMLARVELSYGLSGVDPAPATKDLWLSFVRRGRSTLLAGDTDVETAGGTSWRGPWDYGPLIVYHGATSLVLGHSANADRLPALAALVDEAVPVVTRVWGANWVRQVAVIVPDTQDEMSRIVGGALDLSTIAAVSIADSVSSGVALGQRVVMNPSNLDKYGVVGARIVVQHEVTHIATRTATGPESPTWLVEGFADYVGNLDSGQSTADAAHELRAEVLRDQLPAGLPTSEDFDSRNARAAQAYEEAWLACRLIAQLAGEKGLVGLYRAVGAASGDAGAVGRALQAATGSSMVAFVARWQQYLRTSLA